ncbi:MAG: DNA polymerase III subunit [Planctomycetota bacterium]|jgi:DNA polymerase-3 subunit delta'
MSLKDIFCQDKAISILQRAFAASKSPHAYIFAGPEGVGRFKTAREWAKMLLCKNPVTENGFTDSCGSCESCRLFEAGSHADFHLIYKELREFTTDGKGKKTPVDLPVDVIREFLIDKVSARPTLSERKVFVVSEAERLNRFSQNCLLKVLEEPPDYCTIILLCTRLEKLLPTTKSRCRIIRFGPIAEEKTIEKLKEMGVEQKHAQYWARLARGSLGQACQWARLELADANLYEVKKKLVTSLATTWADLDKATSKTDINRRAQKTLVQIVISALHDAMQLNLAGTKGIVNFDQKEQIKRLTERFDPEKSAEKIADCCRSLRWIESSVNERLIFEQLLLNLANSDKIKV